MADELVRITGLNGEPILIAGSTIYRLRPGDGFGESGTTEVEYAGGYVFTRESSADLLRRLSRDVTLVGLTSRGGQKVYLNPAAVTQVRNALPINGPGTELTVGGSYQHVMEPMDEVERLLGIEQGAERSPQV